MKFILGFKQEMTQVYREDGTIVPVTVVKIEPSFITQVKTAERDGYNAVQVGIGVKKHPGKSMEGHLKPILAAGVKSFAFLREVPLNAPATLTVGDQIAINTFAPGDAVEAIGTSKGRGFQGVVKRHHFHGQPATRGTKDQERMPGSLASKRQGAVRKGQRMAGRMGGDRVTVRNLEIIRVDAEKNLLYVKGALPGARRSMLMILGQKAGDVQVAKNVVNSAQAAAPKVEAQPQPIVAATA